MRKRLKVTADAFIDQQFYELAFRGAETLALERGHGVANGSLESR
jgi:hypothetical protein